MDVRKMINEIIEDEMGVGQDKVKVTVVLPRRLYEGLRRASYSTHQSQNSIVRRAVSIWLRSGGNWEGDDVE